MATTDVSKLVGRRIAPGPYLIFAALFALGTAALTPLLGLGHGAMTAFDAATLVFLAMLARLLGHDAEGIRAAARDNDANRAALLVLTGLVTLVVLVAVAGAFRGGLDGVEKLLVVATLALAWLFSNSVYALHYAHLFYATVDGGDAGGLVFPGDTEPLYWEFVYFGFTLGMTFQTSDVEITGRTMRRVVTGHCLAAFVFNLGVIAFTINVIGAT
ncbi:DUF1345 domain-containing protein [uncultured Sphingomonas sp.]|uniref:DUF1345 domain-containing protein n=1 Tax=uncultured Sphingomonas sp. TaxID=158754 RepID=UPI0035C94E72